MVTTSAAASTRRPAPPVTAGPPAVPPPVVPATFLWLAVAGLAGFGLVLALSADRFADAPRHPSALAVAHLGLLAFLSTAVLGALHQFGPVVGARPLRSATLGRVTAFVFFAGAFVLPQGFAHGPEWIVPMGGLLAFTGLVLAVVNLSRPLSSRAAGLPTIPGIRIALGFLVLTALFGVVYAIDRQTGWFPLYSNRVMAHAHLGLLGWLGLTYVAVAEKLWPMFLLADRPHARAGTWAVRLLALGTALLAPGLLFGLPLLATFGGVIAAVGLCAHLWSFVDVVRRRQRRLELLHAFVIAGCASLVAAVALAAVSGLAELDSTTRAHLTSAEVAALFGWITCAVIGHAHKVVPFIGFGVVRGRGYSVAPDGSPLLFTHLYAARAARATFAMTVAAVALLVGGLAVGAELPVLVAGVLFGVVAVVLMLNLGRGPRRLTRAITAAGLTPTAEGSPA